MAATADSHSEEHPASQRARLAVQHLVDAMDDPVFAYESDGTLVYVNRAYDDLFRARHPAGTLGMNVVDIEPDKRALIVKMIEANFGRRPGDAPLVIESPSVGPDGSPRWYEWRNLQEYDDDGNVTMVIGLSRDITRQRLAELKSQRMTERLEESNRDLLEFAQVASHDLREPLRKVSAFSDRLERKLGGQVDEQCEDYLRRMNSAVARMQGLIDALLTFARVNTRGAPMEITPLDEIIEAVLTDLEIAIDEVGAIIEVEPLPSLPVDASQAGQLFQNLIANALKFRRPGVPPIVSISVEHVPPTRDGDDEPRDGWYDITVRDNGIGFDEKYATKIFAPFQRLHGRADYEGSGVGLSVCRRIVERHQGQIDVRSAEGEGAAFTVRLPTSHLDDVATGGDALADLIGLGAEHSVIDTHAA